MIFGFTNFFIFEKVPYVCYNVKMSQCCNVLQSYNLTMRDIYNLESAKFKHQIYSNKTLFLFHDKSTKLEKIRSHKTRKQSSSDFFLPPVSKNAGQKKLGYRGVKSWNSLDESVKSKSLISFKKNYKKNILRLY